MPPIIQTKAVMYTVKDLLHTLNTRESGSGANAPAAAGGEVVVSGGPIFVQRTPFTDRRVHFVGIGGSGMSGLAHMLLHFGAKVSGTDRTPSSVTRRLSESGAAIGYEETMAALPVGTEIVVFSAAIAADHAGGDDRGPQLCRLRNREICPDARPRHVS